MSKIRCAILLAAIAGVLCACTPEKARTLRLAAVQFRVEALAAIKAVEGMMEMEISSRPRTETEVTMEFVRNALESSEPWLAEDIDLALDPCRVEIAPGEQHKRKAFFSDLRDQYVAFAAIFADIERGNLFTGRAVEKAAELSEKLTIRMSALAESIRIHPPQLLQLQTDLVSTINDIREDETIDMEEKRRRLMELKEQWIDLRKREKELQRSTLEKCLKAGLLGKEISDLIRKYNEWTIGDMETFVVRTLNLVGSLSGEDLGPLTIKTQKLFVEIREDPVWEDVADKVLDEINQLRVEKISQRRA
ncbi:MAG: hypothetical protein JW821_04545 [Deltaproteobacteria bacterium]|nr:hypothetical protein [Deltaproteobacteria bacterium]